MPDIIIANPDELMFPPPVMFAFRLFANSSGLPLGAWPRYRLKLHSKEHDPNQSLHNVGDICSASIPTASPCSCKYIIYYI